MEKKEWVLWLQKQMEKQHFVFGSFSFSLYEAGQWLQSSMEIRDFHQFQWDVSYTQDVSILQFPDQLSRNNDFSLPWFRGGWGQKNPGIF